MVDIHNVQLNVPIYVPFFLDTYLQNIGCGDYRYGNEKLNFS